MALLRHYYINKECIKWSPSFKVFRAVLMVHVRFHINIDDFGIVAALDWLWVVADGFKSFVVVWDRLLI